MQEPEPRPASEDGQLGPVAADCVGGARRLAPPSRRREEFRRGDEGSDEPGNTGEQGNDDRLRGHSGHPGRRGTRARGTACEWNRTPADTGDTSDRLAEGSDDSEDRHLHVHCGATRYVRVRPRQGVVHAVRHRRLRLADVPWPAVGGAAHIRGSRSPGTKNEPRGLVLVVHPALVQAAAVSRARPLSGLARWQSVPGRRRVVPIRRLGRPGIVAGRQPTGRRLVRRVVVGRSIVGRWGLDAREPELSLRRRLRASRVACRSRFPEV